MHKPNPVGPYLSFTTTSHTSQAEVTTGCPVSNSSHHNTGSLDCYNICKCKKRVHLSDLLAIGNEWIPSSWLLQQQSVQLRRLLLELLYL